MRCEIPKSYRAARRAFIAACEAAGVDAIARVQPGHAPDGKPLFMDAASLGPRDAARGLLLVSWDMAGSAIQTGLLREGVKLQGSARLVLVHALDPGAFAGLARDADWSRAMLGAVATEDLAKAKDVTLLALGDGGERLKSVVAERLPESNINVMSVSMSLDAVRRVLAAFCGGAE